MKEKDHWSFNTERAKLTRWQQRLADGTLRGIDGESATPRKTTSKPNAVEAMLMKTCNLTLTQVRAALSSNAD